MDELGQNMTLGNVFGDSPDNNYSFLHQLMTARDVNRFYNSDIGR